jgi:hypothetical protein
MKTAATNPQKHEEGLILAYFTLLVLAAVGIASVGAYVIETTLLMQRRSDMVSAKQFALGGVVIACNELNLALTNTSPGSLATKLSQLANPYTFNAGLSTSASNVYERTIYAPFTNQAVIARIWLPVGSPNSASVVASATVHDVTQTAVVNVSLSWGYPAAIISVNQGTTANGISKSVAQDGNVVINGSSSGPIVVDGGQSLAVLANGRVNYDRNYINAPASAYSMTNWNTANQVPDYTGQGTSNGLFEFSRFIAVADATPGGYAPSGNNHFTNLLTFINAAKAHGTNNPMQGVVVVDVWETDKYLGSLTDNTIPQGINIRGSFMMNFRGPGWDPVSEKIIVTADININPADLSHLVATNPATGRSEPFGRHQPRYLHDRIPARLHGPDQRPSQHKHRSRLRELQPRRRHSGRDLFHRLPGRARQRQYLRCALHS